MGQSQEDPTDILLALRKVPAGCVVRQGWELVNASYEVGALSTFHPGPELTLSLPGCPFPRGGTGEKGMKRRKRKDTKPSRTLPLAASFSGLDEDHMRCCSIAHHILEGPRTGELGSPV